MINEKNILNEQELNQVAGGCKTSSLAGVKPISCAIADTPAILNKDKAGGYFGNVHLVWPAGV